MTSSSSQPQPVPSSQSINQVPVITNVQNLGIVEEPVMRLIEPGMYNLQNINYYQWISAWLLTRYNKQIIFIIQIL